MENSAITLKGLAVLAAVESGLIPEDRKTDEYNIAPFLRFWDLFSPALQQALEESKNVPKMLD